MEEKLNETNQEQNTENKESNGKFYTDEEIAMIEQKAGDKRISQFQKTLEKKQREANKLKNMSESERYEYELSEKERELEERENRLVLSENKAACTSILVQKGLDASLVDFVVDVDAETMNNKIKSLEKAFKASVRNEVEKRLSGNSPKKNLAPSESMTKQDLMKMNVRELQAFKNQNPEVYNTIMNN